MMNKRKLFVRLKGGLGNQMFQYAAGRALALRNNMKLSLDTISGFVNDKVYNRIFSLGVFPIQAEKASFREQLPFWGYQIWNKIHHRNLASIRYCCKFAFLSETEPRYLKLIADYCPNSNTWMEGYWQSEEYFRGYRDVIGQELVPPEPVDHQYLTAGQLIQACDSIALGVRLFEEAPGGDQSGFGGVTPLSFYVEAAERLITYGIKDPTFFIFCTTGAAVQDKLRLPGKVHYIVPENGFKGAIQSLWLMSKCRHHIISNSSFYWWGAWLAEYSKSGNVIIACDWFPNRDAIPARWEKYTVI